MILLVASQKDIASLNIKQQILNRYQFSQTSGTFQQNPVFSAEIKSKKVSLVTLNQESITAQRLPEDFPDANLIVFISRHSSLSGKPTLSVHTPGNFADAELGGIPRALSVSPATAMYDALKALVECREALNLDYEVSYECTHHGPSLNVSTMFIELGSSPAQWNDIIAAQAVAQATMYAIANFTTSTGAAVLGIGGTHYNQKFTKMSLAGEAVFGHMIPKYVVGQVDAQMLFQCIEKTLERVSLAVLDWKGIKSKDKPNLLAALENVGLPYNKA